MRALFVPLIFSVASLVACSDYDFVSSQDVQQSDVDPSDPDRPDDGDDTGGPGDDDPGGPPEDADLPLGAVEGQICDPGAYGWVVGAYVYVPIDEDGDGVEDYRIEAETDAEGGFLLEHLPPGVWTVYVEKGSFTTQFEVTVGVDEYVFLAEPECLDPDSVTIAVVGGEYDHIEGILDTFSISYDFYDGVSDTAYIDMLRDPGALGAYDIVFFNCGVGFDWLTYYSEIGQNLEQYVASGGSFYASDWAYYFVEIAAGWAIDFYGDDNIVGAALVGDVETVTADVIDPYMQSLVGGSTASISFELNNWGVAESTDPDVSVLITSDVGLWQSADTVSRSPLAALIEPVPDQGRIVYTAFHNETQITLDMEALLMEIILSL